MIERIFIKLRIWKYKFLSTCKNVKGKPNIFIPLLLKGDGKIEFGKNVQSGVVLGQKFYSEHNYIIAIDKKSEVIIGDNVTLANGCTIMAKTKITIGKDTMIGLNCFLIDDDGHELSADKRHTGNPKSSEIIIKENVIVYYNSVVMKGVTIGENSVIGSCSVVTKDIPANVFAAGNPARVIRNI